VAGLYPMADRNKRARLRLAVPVVEELDGLIANPEQLSQNRLLKLAAGYAAGYGEVIETALGQSSARTPEAQWQVLRGVLAEMGSEPDPARPGYPRRVVRPRAGLTIRRERTRDGWCLHFTGREAKSGLMDDILDDVEQRFGRGLGGSLRPTNNARGSTQVPRECQQARSLHAQFQRSPQACHDTRGTINLNQR